MENNNNNNVQEEIIGFSRNVGALLFVVFHGVVAHYYYIKSDIITAIFLFLMDFCTFYLFRAMAIQSQSRFYCPCWIATRPKFFHGI